MKRKHSDAINDNFKCSSCDCVFKERDSLNRHVKECHSPLAMFENSAKVFECPIETCDKVFKRKYHLIQHCQTHRTTEIKGSVSLLLR